MPAQEIFEKYPYLMGNVAKNSPLLGLGNSMGPFSFYFNYLHYENMKKEDK